MTIVKLFNGEEFTGNILEEHETDLVLEDFSDVSKPKKIIPKRHIFSIEF